MLNVSVPQLDRLARAGLLPVVYIDRRPRFLEADIEAFIESRRMQANEAECGFVNISELASKELERLERDGAA